MDSKDALKEIQTHLGSLAWRRTTVPQCEKGFPLLLCNPLIHGVEQYMNNHLSTTPEELNFHAELKAASKWRWSGDRLNLDMEESLDGRRKIAAEEILKTWKKLEAELLFNEIYSPGLCVLSFDVSGYIQALEKYLRKAEENLLEVEVATVNDEEQSAIRSSSDTLVPRELVISGGENDPLGGTFIIEYLRVYGHVLCCTDEPAAMRVDFVLDPNGRIIPALSFGLALYTDFEHLPLYYQENPERLWKLNDPQMYRGQIEIALVSNGQYVIRPREPVELETFKSRLRCLRWVKMSSC